MEETTQVSQKHRFLQKGNIILIAGSVVYTILFVIIAGSKSLAGATFLGFPVNIFLGHFGGMWLVGLGIGFLYGVFVEKY